MSATIINQLQELQKDSGKRLHKVVVARLRSQELPRTLVKQEIVSNANYATHPINGTNSLTQIKNVQSIRKVKILTAGLEGSLTYELNTSLLGGRSYPILTAVLGAAIGLTGIGGVGLLFTAGTTGLSLSQTSQRVLARSGDEIWHVEEIGKVKNGSGYDAVYVSSLFIVDPFRRHYGSKGWLIHEAREIMSL